VPYSNLWLIHKYTAEISRLGIPDRVIEHGTQAELWKACGYDADAIIKEVKQLLIKTANIKQS